MLLSPPSLSEGPRKTFWNTLERVPHPHPVHSPLRISELTGASRPPECAHGPPCPGLTPLPPDTLPGQAPSTRRGGHPPGASWSRGTAEGAPRKSTSPTLQGRESSPLLSCLKSQVPSPPRSPSPRSPVLVTDPSLIWALALLALGGERILTASFSHTIWIAAKEPPSQVLAPEVRLRQPGPEAEVPGWKPCSAPPHEESRASRSLPQLRPVPCQAG